MAILLTGVEEDLTSFPGLYKVKMRMTTGDARLQDSISGEAFDDIEDTTQTADADFTVWIPANTVIKSLITGNAVVNIYLIRR